MPKDATESIITTSTARPGKGVKHPYKIYILSGQLTDLSWTPPSAFSRRSRSRSGVI